MLPKERYKKLKEYLQDENPVLVEVIDEYKKLDYIARKIGFLDETQTFTESISWWPLISILGTFSAGKSSFINEYLGKKVQSTGNQAVDDKFTVICYSKNEEVTTLPGVALDADPRFPFYNISKEIEKIDPSEKNINKFLQLKAVNSENIKGKILIDSPGFDADYQRDATLKITNHIINLSDLVLIFFDARHPEPGAMRDTLNHLVENAKSHSDSDKVLYILNQIDTCAKEDNLEEIIGAWQRALSQKGLVSGKFYAIYNETLAKIEDEELRKRLKKKKDEDLQEILQKMDNVIIDRAYRIVKNVETKVKEIKEKLPQLQGKLAMFKKSLYFIDLFYLILLGLGGYYISQIISPEFVMFLLGIGVTLYFILHFYTKSSLSRFLAKRINNDTALKKAFLKHTKWYIPAIFSGWSIKEKKIYPILDHLITESKTFIQKLNDKFISIKKEEEIRQ